jgi:hypothetical protein
MLKNGDRHHSDGALLSSSVETHVIEPSTYNIGELVKFRSTIAVNLNVSLTINYQVPVYDSKQPRILQSEPTTTSRCERAKWRKSYPLMWNICQVRHILHNTGILNQSGDGKAQSVQALGNEQYMWENVGRFLAGANFSSLKRSDRHWGQLSLLINGCWGLFLPRQNGRSVKISSGYAKSDWRYTSAINMPHGAGKDSFIFIVNQSLHQL